MKTIEEMAREYGKEDIEGLPDGSFMLSKHKLELTAKNHFLDGISFAQRWISVKDEMPEYGIPVLVKFINGTYGVGYHLQHERRGYNFYYHTEPSVEFSLHAITHWRPIEFK